MCEMKSRLIRANLGTIAFLFIFVVTFAARSEDGSGNRDTGRSSRHDRIALDRLSSPPLGLPAISVPENNPVTIEKIALGRKLFFDRRLSFNGTMSCGMCHIPEQGFTNNELATSIGVEGRSLRRNAPTILNAAYSKHMFLDGREVSLEKQAALPFLAHDEMANPSAESLLTKLAGLPDYSEMFVEAFGGRPSMERIAKAIASWERTLLAADAPFDRWHYGRDSEALTPTQKRGFVLFAGKGKCNRCHSVNEEFALFTDQSFHNTGIGYRRDVEEVRSKSPVLVEISPNVFVPVARKVVQQVGQSRRADQGRFEVTHEPNDKWRFKTPTLRNVALTAPYMHDGSLRTLKDVVRYYNRGGVSNWNLDPLLKPLNLNDSEINDLVAFLRSLTAGNLSELQADARSVNVGN
jgi:cytochrome c peroxidase